MGNCGVSDCHCRLPSHSPSPTPPPTFLTRYIQPYTRLPVLSDDDDSFDLYLFNFVSQEEDVASSSLQSSVAGLDQLHNNNSSNNKLTTQFKNAFKTLSIRES
jgi:hypothetical protein